MHKNAIENLKTVTSNRKQWTRYCKLPVMTTRFVTIFLTPMFLTAGLSPAQTVQHLKPSAKTVVVGSYDPGAAPALRVKNGDIVEIETLGVNTPELLRRVGVTDAQIQPALLEVVEANPGKRGHFLTGPVYIEGAEPGDVLEVQIRRIALVLPYAVHSMGQHGVLADQFTHEGGTMIPQD